MPRIAFDAATTYDSPVVAYSGRYEAPLTRSEYRAGAVISVLGVIGGTDEFYIGVGERAVAALTGVPSWTREFDPERFFSANVSVTFQFSPEATLEPLSQILGGIDFAGSLSSATLKLVSELTSYYSTGEVETTRDEQQFSITGLSYSGTDATVEAAAGDDARLDSLYPSVLLNREMFPGLPDEHVGRALNFPLGTASRMPASLIYEDPAATKYVYVVCEADLIAMPVVQFLSATTIGPLVEVVGDASAYLRPGDTFWVKQNGYTYGVSGSAEGEYTVAALAREGNNTRIFTVEVLGALNIDGTGATVHIAPRITAVYREGVLVPRAEYRPVILENAPVGWSLANFTNPAAWLLFLSGVATANVTVDGLSLFNVPTLDVSNQITARYYPSFGGPAETQTLAEGRMYLFEVDTEPLNGTVPYGLAMGAHSNTSAAYQRVDSVGFKSGLNQRVPLIIGNQGADARWAFYTWNNNPSPVFVPASQLVRDIRAVNNLPSAPYLCLQFLAEQRDFQGALYEIEVDAVNLKRSRTPAQEINRLLGAAGASVDAVSLALADTVAHSEGIYVDAAYGRDGQKTLRSLLEGLGVLARSSLYLTGSNAYTLITRLNRGAEAFYDETAGAEITLRRYRRDRSPNTVQLLYGRANESLPYQSLVEAPVNASTYDGTLVIESPFLSDAVAAQAVVDYTAAVLNQNRTISGDIAYEVLNVGEVVSLKMQGWAVVSDFFVTKVTRTASGCSFEAIQQTGVFT